MSSKPSGNLKVTDRIGRSIFLMQYEVEGNALMTEYEIYQFQSGEVWVGTDFYVIISPKRKEN